MNRSSLGPWLAIASDDEFAAASAQDNLARELPRIKPLEPAARSAVVPGPSRLSSRASRRRADGDQPRERLLRCRRAALRGRDAGLSLSRENDPRGAWPGSRTATETDGSTRGPSSWTGWRGRRASCPMTTGSSSLSRPISCTPRIPAATAWPMSRKSCSQDSKRRMFRGCSTACSGDPTAGSTE